MHLRSLKFPSLLALALAAPVISFALPSNSIHFPQVQPDSNISETAYFAGTSATLAYSADFQNSIVRLVDSVKRPTSGCSGTVIAPQWILTARHCIPESAGYACYSQSPTAGETCVKADYVVGGKEFQTYEDNYESIYGRLRIDTLRGLGKALGLPQSEIERDLAPAMKIVSDLQTKSVRADWGLVHLESAGPTWAKPIAIAKAGEVREHQPAIAIGFPGYPKRLGYPNDLKFDMHHLYRLQSGDCSIRELGSFTLSDSIFSDCAVTHGNSGGPLLINVKGQLKIAGIASAISGAYAGTSNDGEPAGDSWSLQSSNIWTNVIFYEPLFSAILSAH